MPEYILKFKIPEEETEFNYAVNGIKWFIVVWNLEQYLRQLLKYGHDFKSVDEAIEIIRNKLAEFMEEQGLFFEE